MKSALILGSVFTAAVASASVTLDFRTDLKSVNPDSAAAASTQQYSAFNMTTLRLDASTKLNESTTARIRMKYNKNDQAVYATDGLSDFADIAYIQTGLMDNTTLTAGKMFANIGGYEALNASPDTYLYSAAGTNMTLYRNGADVTYTMGDQKFDLMALNRVGVASDQDSMLTGIVYNGSFLDKSLMPRLSYHSEGYTGLGKATYLGASLRYDNEYALFDLDYLANTFASMQVKSADATKLVDATTGATNFAADTNDASTNTMALSAKIKKCGAWTPIVKYATTSTKNAGVDGSKYTNTGLALEYRPSASNMNYHVAYNQKAVAPATGSTQNVTEVFAGIRVAMDFLK